MSKNAMSVVILAAGKGVRMCSDFPKVLHSLAGKPMIQHVIDTVNGLDYNQLYLVYGYGGDLLKKTLKNDKLNWIFQSEQLGTGHAIQQVAPFINDEEDILILYGDTPLISIETLFNLCNKKPKGGVGLITVIINDPTGYGRIKRENGEITGIIEHEDTTHEQRQIQEINTGIIIASGVDLKRWLSKLTNKNSKREYYLTDIIKIAYLEGCEIISVHPKNKNEVEGVNNLLQLSRLERVLQIEQAEKLLLSGVLIHDPSRFDLCGILTHGQDIRIDTNVSLKGKVKLGHRVEIGTGCVIKDSVIGNDCKISPYSVLENAYLEEKCTVGPFAHIRPGSKLLKGSHVGNFVEIKKTYLGENSKVGHLSYLGDAEVGNSVNIGAGTITCNFDGVNKFKTIIGDDAFIGSNTQIIAPISIGKGATIAAGTTVTRNVEDSELVFSRVPQVNKQGWQRPVKKK